MKQLLYFAIFFLNSVLLTTNTRAQKVLYSDYAAYDIRNSSMSIVGKVNGMLYTYRSYGKEYFLDAWDDEMVKKATVLLDFFPEKIYQIRFVPSENNILVLYQSQEGAKIVQYAALLNQRGILQKRPIKIADRKSSFFGNNPNKEFFSVAVSENKQHIIVYSINKKNKRIDFGGYWLDPFQLKLSRKIKFSFKGQNTLSYSDALLTDAGQFFLPVYTVIGSRNYSDEYALLSFDKSTNLMKPIRLNIGSKFLEYPFQKIDNTSGNIHFASFYSSQKNGNNEGVAATVLDIQKMIFSETQFLPFNDAMRGDSSPKKRAKAFNDFKINRLILKEDGGFLLAAEEQYITTQNTFIPGVGFYSFYYNPVMSQSITEYHYNDILLLSYDKAQQYQWHGFLRKEQYSQEDGGMFSSFCMMNTGGSLGFLFNDFNTRRSRIQLSAVGQDGKINTAFLDAGNNDDPDWMPRLGKQIDSREIIVPCLRKKQLCFAKIVL